MIKKIGKRLAATGAATMLGVGLFIAGPATAAEAKAVWNANVGSLVGYYENGRYHGTKQPAGNWVVWVQRKTASTGVWTLDGVYDPSHNNPSYAESWQIRDTSYAANTTAIRLYRPTTGGYVVLCTTTSQCRGMRV